MKIKSLDHITINVKELDKTLKFYGDLLGLQKLPSVEMDGQTIYYFMLPGGTKLELIYYYHDTGSSDGNELAVGSCRHFAFEVDDIATVVQELEPAGYNFHLKPKYYDLLGCTCGLVRDPNGFELEFVQK